MFSIQGTTCRKICGVAVVIGIAASLSGCGGTSTSSGTNGAFVRTVNTIANAGLASTVVYNGSAIDGTIPPLTTTSYVPLGTGSNSFTFTLSNQPGVVYPTISPSLSAIYYSDFLIGNETVTTKGAPGYPYLDLVADDRTTPGLGNARVRVVQTAPDAPNVDIYLNGTLYQSNVAYGAATPYKDVPAGTVAISETKTGTQTVVAQYSTTFNSPSIYTLMLAETQTSPVTYGYAVLTDG